VIRNAGAELRKISRPTLPTNTRRCRTPLHWTPNLGVPGPATPAYMEIFNSMVVPRMVAKVLKGEQSAEDAAKSGAAEMQRIVDKWNQR